MITFNDNSRYSDAIFIILSDIIKVCKSFWQDNNIFSIFLNI